MPITVRISPINRVMMFITSSPTLFTNLGPYKKQTKVIKHSKAKALTVTMMFIMPPEAE
jgi:hypothetical protein